LNILPDYPIGPGPRTDNSPHLYTSPTAPPQRIVSRNPPPKTHVPAHSSEVTRLSWRAWLYLSRMSHPAAIGIQSYCPKRQRAQRKSLTRSMCGKPASRTSRPDRRHQHRYGSKLATPGRVWGRYEKACAYVPEEKGDGHGNKAEVGGDHRHPGGAALYKRGARVRGAARPWVQRPASWLQRLTAWIQRPTSVWRPACRHQAQHRRARSAILGTALGALRLPASRRRAVSTSLCPALTPGRCRAFAPVLLGLAAAAVRKPAVRTRGSHCGP
jgi:hypothetical protein